MTPEQQINREAFLNIHEKIVDISAQLSAVSITLSVLIETSQNANIIYEALNRKCQALEAELTSADTQDSVGRKLLARISSMREVAHRAL